MQYRAYTDRSRLCPVSPSVHPLTANQGGLTITLALAVAAVLALFAGSLPLVALALVGLAIKIYPFVALVVVTAVAAWALHRYRR